MTGLTARSLVLAKIETTYNVDALPTAAADAFLCSNADVRVDPNVLERDFYRSSISPLPIILGRKLVTVTFQHEVKANGTVGNISKLGTLLRGCGFAQTTIANTAAAVIRPVRAGETNTGPTVTFADTTVPTDGFGRYRLRVVLGGPSATAKLRVTGDPAGGDTSVLPSEEFSARVFGVNGVAPLMTVTVDETDPLAVNYTVAGTFTVGEKIVLVVGGARFVHTVITGDTDNNGVAAALRTLVDAHALLIGGGATNVIAVTFAGSANGVVVTTATPFTVGGFSGQVTPTWSGSLVLNDYYLVDYWRPGVHYTPISELFESITIYVYYDGIVHRITGCMGTVTFTGEAGNFATANFTFTGQYHDPVDAPLPTGTVFEKTLPQQVELAQLKLGDGKAVGCAQSFNVDVANTVTPRDCINATDGFDGVIITTRAPAGTVNPEFTLESLNPFWLDMSTAKQLSYHVRVGTVVGNRVYFMSQSAQYAGITYGDRNGNRTYEIALRFSQDSGDGNDELQIAFA